MSEQIHDNAADELIYKLERNQGELSDDQCEVVYDTINTLTNRAEQAERERDEAVKRCEIAASSFIDAARDRDTALASVAVLVEELSNSNYCDCGWFDGGKCAAHTALDSVSAAAREFLERLNRLERERDGMRAQVAVCVEALKEAGEQLAVGRRYLPKHGSFGEEGIDHYMSAQDTVNAALSNLPAAAKQMGERVRELEAEVERLKERQKPVEELLADCTIPLTVDKQGVIEMCVRDSQNHWVSMGAIVACLNAFAQQREQ